LRELAQTQGQGYARAAERIAQNPELEAYDEFIEANLLQLVGATPKEKTLPGPKEVRTSYVEDATEYDRVLYADEGEAGGRPTGPSGGGGPQPRRMLALPAKSTVEDVDARAAEAQQREREAAEHARAVEQQRKDSEEFLKSEGERTERQRQKQVIKDAKARAKTRTQELQDLMPDEMKPGNWWERTKRFGRGVRGLFWQRRERAPQPGEQMVLEFMTADGTVREFNIERRDRDLVVSAAQNQPEGLSEYLTTADRNRRQYLRRLRDDYGIERTDRDFPVYIHMSRVRSLQAAADQRRGGQPAPEIKVEEREGEEGPLIRLMEEGAAWREHREEQAAKKQGEVDKTWADKQFEEDARKKAGMNQSWRERRSQVAGEKQASEDAAWSERGRQQARERADIEEQTREDIEEHDSRGTPVDRTPSAAQEREAERGKARDRRQAGEDVARGKKQHLMRLIHNRDIGLTSEQMHEEMERMDGLTPDQMDERIRAFEETLETQRDERGTRRPRAERDRAVKRMRREGQREIDEGLQAMEDEKRTQTEVSTAYEQRERADAQRKSDEMDATWSERRRQQKAEQAALRERTQREIETGVEDMEMREEEGQPKMDVRERDRQRVRDRRSAGEKTLEGKRRELVRAINSRELNLSPEQIEEEMRGISKLAPDEIDLRLRAYRERIRKRALVQEEEEVGVA